ncbi:MAG: universal stress protein UspA [Gammaproteobacteria bacterium RIFCSPHIGHO2_12_FULL_41_15]|nr:MAG: universal stress protein UspA [Gammaproteobacteria bacterium RIFCSPHIGHO2_12_FULL_41_15]
MREYQRILLALELLPENDTLLIEKAQEVTTQEQSQLYLLHAVEHLSSFGVAYGVSAGVDVEEMLLEEARKTMSDLGNQLNIPEARQLVKVGPAKFVILEEAERLPADLIVVGSHGRHGVRLLLGSTANAILHSAKCDVLAVRVQK